MNLCMMLSFETSIGDMSGSRLYLELVPVVPVLEQFRFFTFCFRISMIVNDLI